MTSYSFKSANRGVCPIQPLIPVSIAATPECEHTEALMSQCLKMSAWQVKSRTGFNGSTSDGANSPVRPRECCAHESPAGIVENSGEHDGGTDFQAKGISPHSRRTGSAWSEYRCTTWWNFNCILADSTLVIAYFAPAELRLFAGDCCLDTGAGTSIVDLPRLACSYMMRPNAAEPMPRHEDQPEQQQESLIWQEFRSSAAARGLSARMTIFDQPLEARLRACESANRYDRPCNVLHLILICCWEPMGANSILTLELISGLQLAQDLPNGESSSGSHPHPSATTSVPTPCLLGTTITWSTRFLQAGSREIATDTEIHQPC